MSKLTTSDRKERLATAYNHLLEKEGILTLLKLRASASLSRFSMGNIVNLWFESFIRDLPMPTMLHTYKDWAVKDRQVKKGEHAWHVLAPIRMLVWQDKDDHSLGKHQVLTGWFLMNQFDVKQTDGEELVELCGNDLDSNEYLDTLLQLVEWCIYDQDIPVNWVDHTKCGGAKGWWHLKNKDISIDESLSNDEALAVLIHECIHAVCDTNYKDFTREDAEMITESACAIVCMGLGLDHLTQSLEYVAAWSCDDPKRAVLLFDKAEQCATLLEKATGLSRKGSHAHQGTEGRVQQTVAGEASGRDQRTAA